MRVLALLGAMLCTGFGPGPALAQASGPQGDRWESIKQLPDFTGPWRSNDILGRSKNNPDPMPLTPTAKANVEKLAKIRAGGGDVEGRAKYCLTLGFPGGMTGPEEISEILYVPGRVILTDVQSFARMIYTDGRKHHTGPPTMGGDSIGHWENKTLVVDTVGMHHGNEIAYGLPGGRNMHVVERISLKDGDPNTMITQVTYEAPEVFTRPYVFTAVYQRHRDWQMTEWDCAQNNRDLDKGGKQQMNLTMPEERPTTLPPTPRRTRGSRKD